MTKFKDIIFEKGVAIHCPEEWMANELLTYADSKGYHWSTEHSYLQDNKWHAYRENTFYSIWDGFYGAISHLKDDNYKILHYNDVVIREEDNMETSLKYKLMIKGKEAKIGDKLFLGGEQITLKGIEINDFNYSIKYIAENGGIGYLSVIDIVDRVSWEKPKRDFSPYFNFDEAPNRYDFGGVDKDGRAYWYKGKPTIDINKWRNGGCFCDAGFRQNLINPETGKVDDWKDSLVERQKGK